jgi:hypothetical protein
MQMYFPPATTSSCLVLVTQRKRTLVAGCQNRTGVRRLALVWEAAGGDFFLRKQKRMYFGSGFKNRIGVRWPKWRRLLKVRKFQNEYLASF